MVALGERKGEGREGGQSAFLWGQGRGCERGHWFSGRKFVKGFERRDRLGLVALLTAVVQVALKVQKPE